MLPSYIKTAKDPCALIEGAGFGEADFYGRWLIAAAEAESIWKIIQREEQFFGLTWGDIPDLGLGAIYILSRIKHDYCIVSLRPTQEMVEWPIMLEFVLMVELGLLTLTGTHYQITIPPRGPNSDEVRAAALKLSKTGDENSTAYPERFITAMTRFEAERWRRQTNDTTAGGRHAPHSRTYH
jgi:hypothetical protein